MSSTSSKPTKDGVSALILPPFFARTTEYAKAGGKSPAAAAECAGATDTTGTTSQLITQISGQAADDKPRSSTRLTSKIETVSGKTASIITPQLQKKQRLSVRRPDEILAMEFDQGDLFLDNGIFAKGQAMTLIGPGGIGKSRILLMFAVCTILGRDFFGLKVNAKKLKWLIIQLENGNRRLKADLEKLKAWVGDADWPVVNEHLVIQTLDDMSATSMNLKDPGTVEALKRLVRAEHRDAVAFDPLNAVGTGLNSDDGMRKTYDRLMEIARCENRNASVVILHHAAQGKRGAAKAVGHDRETYGRNSKALHAMARGQINIAPAGADDNSSLVVSCAKNSNGPEFQPFGICLNPETQLHEVDPDFDLEAWKEEMSGETAKKQKFSVQDVADLVREKGLKRHDLIAKIMTVAHCKKSTAYNLVKDAADQTIRLNQDGEYIPA